LLKIEHNYFGLNYFQEKLVLPQMFEQNKTIFY
jgi:hypothetical protein